MGNITLSRSGKVYDKIYGITDDLTYQYDGNRLIRVTNHAADTPAYKDAMYYADGADLDTERTYDANGNMTSNADSRISHISYDALNMPCRIDYIDGSHIDYTYAADGAKQRVDYYLNPYTSSLPDDDLGTACDSSLLVHTWREYAGNCVYVCDTLSMILIDGGYITFDYTTHQPIYHYYLKDYLGNNRITVSLADGRIEEVNHYYPFGALMGDRCGVSRNKYKYIGKELDTMYGWNMQDHEARWYDPIVGRWMVTDPLQEKYFDSSLYCYTGNNPIRFSDPNGQDWWDKVIGFWAAIADNATGGLTNIRTYAGRNVSDPKDFNAGLTTGDLASLTVGSIESGTGATMVASGTTITTVGLVAEGPSVGTSTVAVVAGGAVLKTGVVLTAHGAVMMANAGKNLTNKNGHINANSSNSTQKSSQPKNTGKNTVIFTQGKGSKATRIKTPIPDGYRKIKGFSHGIPVYTNGKNYITPDVDGHNGGIWKMGKSVKALQNKHTRMGTYNAILKRIGD